MNINKMGFQVHFTLFILQVFVGLNLVFCVDLTHTNIKTVTDDTRYLTLNPEVKLTAFNKVNHVKGNTIFSSGERIDGDRLILTYMDETQYTRKTDIEVSLWYPASGKNGLILSSVQIYVDQSSEADAYFVDGTGIGRTYAEILMASNQTINFGYQLYLYGY